MILENNTQQYDPECQDLKINDNIKLSIDITYESKDSNTVEANEIANLITSGREYSSKSHTELTPVNTISTNQSGMYTEDMSALFGSSFSSTINLIPTNQAVIESIAETELINPFDRFIATTSSYLSNYNAVVQVRQYTGDDNQKYAVIVDKPNDLYKSVCDPNRTWYCSWQLVKDISLYTFEDSPWEENFL